jgi:uncharacterized protein
MSFTVAGDPQAGQYRLFDSAVGPHLLVVPHSRIFAVAPMFADALRAGDPCAQKEVAALAASIEGEEPLDLVPTTTPQSISLNVSATCNLGCGYCYADRGSFAGKQPSTMGWETARAAVDRLFKLADHNLPITVGFIGGEPFLNRKLIQRVVEYCWNIGRRRGQAVAFAVTTNGTQICSEDISMLRAYPFAVTISIDGGPEIQNVQRPSRSARSSFAAVRDAVSPLLEKPGMAKIAARATVVRSDLQIGTRFDEIIGLGFREVGFAPVRTGASRFVLNGADWGLYLAAITALARRELAGALAGSPIRLTNLAIALKQLHRGFSMPYPCGAGGGYFSVAADGTWYACHRAIGQPAYQLGDNQGLDEDRRASFLLARHVHQQPQCRSCWARYLCSGGCHQEASSRSDSSCGFIRGWLEFCLGAYAEMIAELPGWFATKKLNAGDDSL